MLDNKTLADIEFHKERWLHLIRTAVTTLHPHLTATPPLCPTLANQLKFQYFQLAPHSTSVPPHINGPAIYGRAWSTHWLVLFSQPLKFPHQQNVLLEYDIKAGLPLAGIGQCPWWWSEVTTGTRDFPQFHWTFSLKAEHAMRSYLPQLTKTGTSTNWYMHAGQQLAYNIHKHECIPIASYGITAITS